MRETDKNERRGGRGDTEREREGTKKSKVLKI